MRPDFRNIYRFPKSNLQSFSLPYCIKWISLMSAKNAASLINEESPIDFFFQAFHLFLEETAIIIIGHKANFIALAFFSELGIAVIHRHLPDLGFTIGSKRKYGSA